MYADGKLFISSTGPNPDIGFDKTDLMARKNEDSAVQELANIMIKASNESRGTVASLAAWTKEVDDTNAGEGTFSCYPPMIFDMISSIDHVKWELSPRYTEKTMNRPLYYQMLCHLTKQYPSWHLHSSFGRQEHADSQPMFQQALFFDYVVLHGHRYYSSVQSGAKHSSLVEVDLPSRHPSGYPRRGRGELLEILQFQQSPGTSPVWVARMRWFIPWTGERDPVWEL